MAEGFPLIPKDPEASPMHGLGDIVTHECICGSSWFNLQVTFHEYEIGSYLTLMECANCGTLAQAPTLLDSPEFQAWRADTPPDVPNAAYRPESEYFPEP